jgi:hypothetical protein
MTRSTLALLAASMLLAAVPLSGATHDPDSEKKADCENAHNQGWIGYNNSRTVRYLYENASKTSPFSTATVDNCEGEHWDGQDSVNNGANNEPTSTSETQCAPKASETSPTDFSVTQCQRADINDNGDGPLGRTPVGARASGKGSGDGRYQEVYVGLDIMLVGRVATYQGTCSDGAAGLEGAQACDSGNSTAHGRQTRSAVYVRDNTPQNVLAQAVSSAGVTRGEAGDGDCSQERYQDGVEAGSRAFCTRDNTAITAETLLP